jgi:Mg-chelatase subunit ChlD
MAQTIGAQKQSASNTYLAYRYLLDGNSFAAEAKGKLAGSSSAQTISALADCASGDYVSGYFNTERLLAESGLSDTLRSSMKQLNELCAKETGISGSAVKNLADLSTPPADDGEQEQKQVRARISACFAEAGFSDAARSEYDDLYKVDRLLNTSAPGALSEEDVNLLLKKYPGHGDVYRLTTKYYLSRQNYTQARAFAKKLLDTAHTPENYVVYTDVIAESARNGASLASSDDPEVKSLLKRAADLEKQAGETKQETLKNEALELKKQAGNVDIARAINYLTAKRPILGDSSGLYDIQLAKLTLAEGDRTGARQYIEKAIQSTEKVQKDSPVKQALQEVIEVYNRCDGYKTDPVLSGAVRELVAAQSQEVVPITENTVNGQLSQYITSTLKYDRVSIHIGKMDTSRYPTVRAYANVNGRKGSQSGLADDFSSGDFSLTDTQYGIKNFKIVKDAGSDKVSIAMVLDCSGSMAGVPVENARGAAADCIKQMNSAIQEMALISYNDTPTVETAPTGDRNLLLGGVNHLAAGGGTNIPSALETGVDTLSGAKGRKAIILMTDGQDNNSQETMDAVVKKAAAENVPVFAVGFGEVNGTYLQNITEKTGGVFIQADNSAELSDVYLTLQQYIVNNYCFEYTVTANPKTDPRSLTVRIPKYRVSDTRNYSISGGTGSETGPSAGITAGNAGDVTVSSISPNGVSSDQVRKGIEVSIKGTGFAAGANFSIDNIALTGVRVVNSGTATGRLEGSLPSGSYACTVSLPDGHTAVAEDAFYVFRAGCTASVRLGDTLITAERIGQTTDNQFVASGNVMINGFLRSSAPMTIKAYELPEKFSLTQASGVVSLGKSGSLSGKGKLYISYGRASAQNKSFANLALDGKDCVVSGTGFAMGVDGEKTDVEKTISSFDFNLPKLGKVNVGGTTLYADRLQLDVRAYDSEAVFSKISSLFSKKRALDQDIDSLISGQEPSKHKITETGLSGDLSLALTAQDIVAGGDVKYSQDKDCGPISMKDIEFKLNTLDMKHEYWEIKASFGFPRIADGLKGLDAEVSSYYWLPDSIRVDFEKDPGIPIYKVLTIDKIGAKVQGISTIAIAVDKNLLSTPVIDQITNSKTNADIEKKDVELDGTVNASANMFHMMDLKVGSELEKWGELDDIDGEVGIGLSNPGLHAKADIHLLNQKVAGADIAVRLSGFEANGNLQANLSGFGMGIGGKID